jgi:hypothetical protein
MSEKSIAKLSVLKEIMKSQLIRNVSLDLEMCGNSSAQLYLSRQVRLIFTIREMC